MFLNYLLLIFVSLFFIVLSTTEPNVKDFERDGGRATGLLPQCKPHNKSITISKSYLNQRIKINVQTKSPDGNMMRKKYLYKNAAKLIAKDFSVALKKKKTLIFLPGWLDMMGVSFIGPVVANSFSNLGYNVIVFNHEAITLFQYDVAVAFTKMAGQITAQFINDIEGLKPENVLIVGMSLGGQIMGFTGKEYFKMTGKKIGEMIALDPAGPCFRVASPENRLSPDDATFVQVIHTNIDGLGIADAIGDVDFYVNGGENQAGILPQIPCLGLCSHMRAYELMNAMIAFPDQFVGVLCNSVQQAREYTCYENTPVVTNVMGLKVDRTKRGVYLLPTSHKWPFHRGMKAIIDKYFPLDDYHSFGSKTNANKVELNEDYWDRASSILEFE